MFRKLPVTRWIGVPAIVLGLALAPQATFAEGKKPVGGCAATFERMTIDEILPFAAVGFTREDFEAEDKNEDNFLCVKFLPHNPLFEPVTFLFFDNDKLLRD